MDFVTQSNNKKKEPELEQYPGFFTQANDRGCQICESEAILPADFKYNLIFEIPKIFLGQKRLKQHRILLIIHVKSIDPYNSENIRDATFCQHMKL